MTRNNPSIHPDEWLADFADQILDGKTDSPPADGPDPETRALAGTLLRLKHALPKQELDSALVKRIQARVLKKWRDEEQKKPRWLDVFRLDWLSLSNRRSFGLALAAIVLAGILVVTVPILFSNSGPLSASAGIARPGAFIWIALGVLVVSIGWLLRRKP